MTAPLDWRKIEAALVEWYRAEGWAVESTPDTGDVIAENYEDGPPTTINLTVLAKHLADELAPPP